jgi:hypothetical protein
MTPQQPPKKIHGKVTCFWYSKINIFVVDTKKASVKMKKRESSVKNNHIEDDLLFLFKNIHSNVTYIQSRLLIWYLIQDARWADGCFAVFHEQK